ncbi:helix-turn-helix domain-containing protein [Nocardioides zeae]|uniref:Purine catabolism regulator n=1 Tax=Nocardioides zeae TaxID=1457234 RepID=A0AAJ1U3H0_9ACTN|nr:PucR family transcriptional regulator [Nocardioides zeae]MDQ1105225.1 purine catabolism regulator [Nocardioides zeae]
MVPLQEVLRLPSFLAAAPEVRCGDVAAAQVRWVHSSEVYEMGGLLGGGELLLTTGLGLHGRSDAQLAAYVDELVAAGCVALGLELGRSLLDVPAPLERRAAERGLVLLVLGAGTVVPFERHVEDFHELVVRRRTAPGGGETVARRFVDLVVRAAGLPALLDEVARAAGCQVELHDLAGRLVERSRIRTVAAPDATTTAPVAGARGVRAVLVLRAEEDGLRRRTADEAAVAVALELGRHADVGGHASVEQALVTDLHAGGLVSTAEVLARLRHAGLRVAPGDPLATLALDAGPAVAPTDLLAALQTCAEGVALVSGVLGTHVVGVVRLAPGGDTSVLRRRLEDLAARLSGHLGPAVDDEADVRVALTTPDPDAGTLAARLEDARDLVRLARRHGGPAGVVLARDLGVQRLLTGATDAQALSDFVVEQIGPLVDADRAHGPHGPHGAALLRTLDAYLGHGLSKAATAEALGIRRQSLYGRLERIERLLGVRLDDPGHRAGLVLALTAWRLRTGLDPQAAF